MDKFLKFYKAIVKSVNDKEFTLEAMVSTKKVDREGDVIEPEAFKKRIKTYKDHPVLLSSHSYGDLRKQIGEAKKIEINEEGVLVTFKYYVGEGNPEADWAWVLGLKGIASFSVGFIGHTVEWIKEKYKDDTGGTIERITGRRFMEIELLEISQVVVPANAGALQLSINQAKEEAEVGELVAKGMKDGTIKEVVVEETKAEVKAESKAEDKTTHYSEVLLGEGSPEEKTGDSVPAPKEKPESEVLASVAKEAVQGSIGS